MTPTQPSVARLSNASLPSTLSPDCASNRLVRSQIPSAILSAPLSCNEPDAQSSTQSALRRCSRNRNPAPTRRARLRLPLRRRARVPRSRKSRRSRAAVRRSTPNNPTASDLPSKAAPWLGIRECGPRLRAARSVFCPANRSSRRPSSSAAILAAMPNVRCTRAPGLPLYEACALKRAAFTDSSLASSRPQNARPTTGRARAGATHRDTLPCHETRGRREANRHRSRASRARAPDGE